MNSLKMLIPFSFFLLLCNLSYGQDCNFDIDEVDKFSGEISRKVDQRMGSITTHWNLILEQKGKKYFIGLKTLTNQAIQTPISKGDKFYLKLEDGKVIAVAADQDYSPSFYGANGGVQVTITTKGEVDMETMKNLSMSPITDIKLTVGGNELTQSKIMSKQTKKVMSSAACMVVTK